MKFEELEKIKDISALKDNYDLEKQKEKANFEDIFENLPLYDYQW